MTARSANAARLDVVTPITREPEPREAESPSRGDRVTNVVEATATEAANDTAEAAASNLVRRTVDEIYALMADSHTLREELLAHGVQFHMLNAMIELGVHDKPEERARMVDTAVEASRKAHGPQAVTHEELVEQLDELVTLEKDLRHVRHVASQQGVHMQALNHLTQLMRLNPGDRGVHAINTFIAYADAAGVDLSESRAILDSIDDEPESVLPKIDRAALDVDRSELKSLLQNIAIGLVLTLVMFWFVL